jgi:hypothetical protein
MEVRGAVTIQEPSRGGDPEANLTGENSGIPGGTFRSGSRLVRVVKTPPPLAGGCFYTSRIVASSFSLQ